MHVSVTGQCWNRCVSEDYRFNNSARILMLHIIYYYTYSLSPCQIFKTIHIHKYVRIVLLLYVLCITYRVVLFLWHFFFNYDANCQHCTIITYLTVNCSHTIAHVDGRTVSCCCFAVPLTQISRAQNIRTRVDEGRRAVIIYDIL